MERYDKLVTEIQELIRAEETEIELLQYATGITAQVAISIRRDIVTRLKKMLIQE